jgi:hypothetical protein
VFRYLPNATYDTNLRVSVSKLQLLHSQLGIEFALFATRGSLQDELDPVYFCSDKVKMFLEGHLNVPPKELLKLMDASVVTGVQGMSYVLNR